MTSLKMNTSSNAPRNYALLALIQLLALCVAAQKQSIAPDFPRPSHIKDMLFYVQRSLNKNTVVYELNYNADSTVNEQEPVKVYWIQYADKGQTEPLSGLQKKFSYGVYTTLTDKDKKSFKLTLAGYPQKDIFLLRSGSGDYKAYISVNGKTLLLERIFFNINGGSYMNPNVEFIEVTGKDIKTNKQAIEIFKP